MTHKKSFEQHAVPEERASLRKDTMRRNARSNVITKTKGSIKTLLEKIL